MSEEAGEFPGIVVAVLRRFFTQNAQVPPPAAELATVAARLRALVAERGLPRPLAPGEPGAPGGMGEPECAPLVLRVAGEDAPPLLAEAVRQLVKACFYPEFTVCRESYRETGADGACRRQELARVLRRISGAHCVDCPHWVAHKPEAHRALLENAWCSPQKLSPDQRGVFLPEDFRALRLWLHREARRTARG
ncbi:MAG: hypothetical protein JNK23_16750 [Opitutaceae bacterium]|nr:hypothetical protein [Opitutaceae bacterium]